MESPFADVPLLAGEDIVAWGRDLDPGLVLSAYREGVFPFYDAGGPVLWWCPDPRAVLPLDERFHVRRRLARRIRRGDFEIRIDSAFEEVMRACDEGRADGTWIHEDMIRSYCALHEAGHAHSVEVWRKGQLVGGIYGIAFGAGFAAESMFHRERDMSKVALVSLVEHLRRCEFQLLDVQFKTPHLEQFGCIEMPRDLYLEQVRRVRDVLVLWS